MLLNAELERDVDSRLESQCESASRILLLECKMKNWLVDQNVIDESIIS